KIPVSRFVAGIRHSGRVLGGLCQKKRQLMSQKENLALQRGGRGGGARRRPHAASPFYLSHPDGGRRNAALRRGSGPPEKVFNELWKPSRGRLGARRDCKVPDDHKAVHLSLQVGV